MDKYDDSEDSLVRQVQNQGADMRHMYAVVPQKKPAIVHMDAHKPGRNIPHTAHDMSAWKATNV
jgi:hypothetical protein